MNKIPVIGTVVINNTHWLKRLIMSVDYPVDTFVIINNNNREDINEDLKNISKIKHKYIDNIKVSTQAANIGRSGAWNLIIKCFMNSPYWIICHDDVAFKPGLLREMADAVNNDSELGLLHSAKTEFGLGSWNLFLIRDITIQKYGIFDENTYPIYGEEYDYELRMSHDPIKRIIGTTIDYYHGDSTSSGENTSNYGNSRSDTNLKNIIDESYEKNIEYLSKKWGADWRYMNPTLHPFENDDEIRNTITTYDLNFIRSKYTGF